ncbi:MAG: polyphosphate kinase 2 family protein [Hydrocarboniphaga sp.]|uniref:PPK2 family polyphosphate kinase n=1 Tax=Hydrocarboniphaga sp. TaxID=2033016 RepID=UPI00262471A1|nr:PPK2 family polyphosphate kinase [Hydrocarboniphaga sp.]MDB5972032.1 polyphosphate kinase 2 family protein [Hydrocarboniphaga sp.]
MSDLKCAVDSPYLAPFNGKFRVADAPTSIAGKKLDRPQREAKLAGLVAEMSGLQHVLYADNRYSLLLIFQAMDAAGKDSTIRAVLTGVDPAGCTVHAFKRPSDEELEHDFLWRTSCRLPARGQIGVFNRSYYEEVLVTRVNPALLAVQHLPRAMSLPKLWKQRYRSIRDHEQHLACSGTIVLKFWLNVSAEEQRQRFLARLDQPEKNWKFESGDLGARDHWGEYQQAYEDAINATSREWAPWYAIPADSKSSMRVAVADIIVRTLKSLDLRYPVSSPEQLASFAEMRKKLGE